MKWERVEAGVYVYGMYRVEREERRVRRQQRVRARYNMGRTTKVVEWCVAPGIQRFPTLREAKAWVESAGGAGRAESG